MTFDQIPIIPAGNIYRAAHVSSTRGDRELRRLAAERVINPMKTPTGRVLLTPPDGKAVYDRLIG